MFNLPAELTVKAEPVQYAVLGQSSELLCTVQSRPSPNIQWCRVSEGSETDLLRQHNSNSDNFGVYRIEHTRLEDAGLYRCKGFYSFGNEMTDIQLVVLSESVKYCHRKHYVIMYTQVLCLTASIMSFV